MRIELIHGPLDGIIRVVPEGTKMFEVAMGGRDPYNFEESVEGMRIYIYGDNSSVISSRGDRAFTFLGTRSLGRWRGGPRIK